MSVMLAQAPRRPWSSRELVALHDSVAVSRLDPDDPLEALHEEEIAVGLHMRAAAAWRGDNLAALDQLAAEVAQLAPAAQGLQRDRLTLLADTIDFRREDVARRQRWSAIFH